MPPHEALVEVIAHKISVPFLESWLQATLLSRKAVEAYWNVDHALRMDLISCETKVTGRDIWYKLVLRGRNSSLKEVEACPMLFVGGSVLHFDKFSRNTAYLVDDSGTFPLTLKSRLDLGQLHFFDILFPSMLGSSGEFVIEQEYDWPGSMTPGTDVIFYPYGAIFAKDVDQMKISVTFDTPVAIIRGYVANLDDCTCKLSNVQPAQIGTTRMSYQWLVTPVDGQALYIIMFDRR
jgi:hypothetical protein